MCFTRLLCRSTRKKIIKLRLLGKLGRDKERIKGISFLEPAFLWLSTKEAMKCGLCWPKTRAGSWDDIGKKDNSCLFPSHRSLPAPFFARVFSQHFPHFSLRFDGELRTYSINLFTLMVTIEIINMTTNRNSTEKQTNPMAR